MGRCKRKVEAYGRQGISNGRAKTCAKRIRADYDMKSADFQSHLEFELDVARTSLIIAQLESCYQQPLRNQLKDGIQEYEQKINRGSIASA